MIASVCTDSEEQKSYLLQRCPFCGMDVATIWSTTDRDGEEHDDVVQFTVVCDFQRNGCGANCGWHHDAAKAVSRWNTRVVI